MHMGHIALRVRDPDAVAAHLEEGLGLRRTLEAGGSVFLSCNEKHHEVQLIPAPAPGLDHLGIEVEDIGDLGHLRDALVAAGARILSEQAEEPGLGESLRAVGPEGLVLELYAGMPREPLSVAHYMPPLARRYGHVTLTAEDRVAMERFLIEALGMRVTDQLGDRVSWLRCDSEHHGIGVVQYGRSTLHHYAFQLENWSAIQRYADHLALIGRRLVWGPGRHGPGRNLYAYAPDPENVIVEAYADLLHVENEATYEPIDWAPLGDLALNLWGPGPPPDWREYGVPILAPETG
jgi:catechol-2,3-dioxygenase